MNRFSSLIVAGIACALLFDAGAAAQSLGEVARREQANKSTRRKARRVYTTDDFVRPEPPVPASGAAPASTAADSKPKEHFRLAPFVPTPEFVVEKMLEVAGVGPDDTVYDLGCGDGRILIMAAQEFGANAVGVELDEVLYNRVVERVEKLGLKDKIKIIHGDLLDVDLSPATVVTLYLEPNANERVRPNLEKYLRHGARVVSHDFAIPGWEPDRVERPPQEGATHRVYLYRR